MGRFTARGLAIGVLSAVMLAASPATAGFAAPTPAVAAISATPSTDLADGQQVTVTGTGYPANHTVDLVECAQDLGCDFSNLRSSAPTARAATRASFFVRRILTLESLTVDCAIEQNCILVSLDITDLSTGSQTSITFDPTSLRCRRPTSASTPTAPATCASTREPLASAGPHLQPGPHDRFVDDLTQVWRSHIFQSQVFIAFECTHGTQRFAVTFRPANGLFGRGAATIDIDAFTDVGGVGKHKKADVTLVATSS